MPATVSDPAIARASRSTGCPADQFIVSATHTHSGGTGMMGMAGKPDAQQVEEAIVTAVNQAKAALRPARIGFGTTQVYLNMNRDVYFHGRWIQGPNPEGGSDKTLSVIEFLGADDLPIAVYMNYAMHPIDYFLSGVVSADFPGEASRYVERRYGPKMVGVFVQGASGNQNPMFARPLQKLIGVRTRTPGMADDHIHSPSGWEVAASELNAVTRQVAEMAKPVTAQELAAYQDALVQTSEIVTAMGAIIGEATIDVMRNHTSEVLTEASIWGGARSFNCPGRDRLDQSAREGVLPPYKDGPDVRLRVGGVRLGDILLTSVNGEVYNDISVRLNRESAAAKTMMVTLANGMANSGYIYSNEAGSHLTFQVIGSRLKPGCAEDSIVAAGLELAKAAGF
jgi:neutral ceramidase